MGLTPQDLQALLDAFEASSWQDMTVEVDSDRLHVSRRASVASGAAAPVPAPLPAGSATVPTAGTGANGDGQASSKLVEVSASASTTPAAGVVEADVSGTPILAPSVGVFWRSPSPGAPPFVEVGTPVGPEDTVAILEIMKLMKPLAAGVAGTVSAILVDNGATVEYGQPLVVVEPGE